MHVAFGSNDNYAQHLAVTMASFLVNLKPGIVPHIYVMTDGLSDKNRSALQELQQIRPFQLSYLTMDKTDFDQYPAGLSHLNYTVYFRLRLPEILPHLDKILYLDIDTIIDGDVYPLWETELTSNDWIAGALELEVGPEFCKTLGLAPDDLYINSGVMVMNLKALREHHFEKDCIAYAASHYPHIKNVDQDIINYVCRGHLKLVDPKYNMIFSRYYHGHRLGSYKSAYTLDQLKNALKNPVVIHFVGRQKAWFYGCRHNLAYKYKDYLALTPWKNYRYPDKSLRVMFSKYMFFVRQWLKHRRALAKL